MDDTRELVLKSTDACGDDRVGIESANCLDIIKESCWNCVVVEWLIGVSVSTVKIDAFLVLWPIILILADWDMFQQDSDIPFLLWILLVPVVQVM